MSIAPIVHTVQVKAPPARAFEIFTSRMQDWWPAGHTVGKKPHVAIVMEPHVGGRWFERDAEGTETQWGQVLAWEPPSRALLAWQLNSQWTFDPEFRNRGGNDIHARRRRRHAGDGWSTAISNASAPMRRNMPPRSMADGPRCVRRIRKFIDNQTLKGDTMSNFVSAYHSRQPLWALRASGALEEKGARTRSCPSNPARPSPNLNSRCIRSDAFPPSNTTGSCCMKHKRFCAISTACFPPRC